MCMPPGSIKIKLSSAAKQLLADKGFDPSYGARPVKRTIQRLVEYQLSEEILKGAVKPGDTVEVESKDGIIQFKAARSMAVSGKKKA